ncbi:MAG: hypothetical protein GY807_20440 [Gammaproteobacteria bacterium]|nr:hypothetical protein [Gammaproteobacteria bacterium]
MKVELIGEGGDLIKLAAALRSMEYFGNIGASRDISLFIDGDGAGQVKVVFPDFDEELPVPAEAKEAADTGKGIRYMIGD